MRPTALTVCVLLAFSAAGNLPSETLAASAPSLLHGATPSNFTVPPGWKLERTQDFESGLGSQEFVFPPATICTPPQGAHSGTKTECGGSSKGWGIEPAPFVEHYISYWQYMPANATFNDEMLEWHMLHNSGTFQETLLDWYPNSRVDPIQGWGEFNSKYAKFKAVSNGPRDKQFGSLLGDTIVPVGRWFQMEVHWKPNTPGGTDGILDAWQDGVLISITRDNLNGSVDMKGSRLSIGGSYTKLVWWTNSSETTCSDAMSKGYNANDAKGRCNTTPCICQPEPPNFNRYFDDVIILVPGTSATDLPAGPPSAPFGLKLQ